MFISIYQVIVRLPFGAIFFFHINYKKIELNNITYINVV